MLFKYQIEIDINESAVYEKYPNYKFNYSSPKELADSIAFGVQYEADTDMSKDGLKQWGYSIKVKRLKS